MSKPTRKLFVMRHAESLEDVDKTAYERIADEDMPLTENGKKQAAEFSAKFALELGSRKRLRVILSPCKRVLETAEAVISGIPKGVKWSLHTDSLIAKQNWGEVTIHSRSEIEKERYRIGVLRYRFPGGESGAEMVSRFELFARKLKLDMQEKSGEHVLVVTNGFGFRLLLKSLLGWTEEYFESLAHPHYCELKRIAYDRGTFLLLDEVRIHDPSTNPNFVRRQPDK